MRDSLLKWIVSPRVVLPASLVAIIAIVLLSPASEFGSRNDSLTTRSPGAGGAQGYFETLDRLGWSVAQRVTPFGEEMPRDAVYAILAPVVPITPGEAHELLTAVREGGRLLFVMAGPSPLSDSLSVAPARFGLAEVSDSAGVLASINQTASGCRRSLIPSLTMVPERFPVHSITRKSSMPDERVVFIEGSIDTATVTIAAGFALGAGKVLAVAEPTFFRNDVIHACTSKAGILTVRMMEWLGDSTTRTVIFDEYHQGHGMHPSTMRAVRRAVTEHPAGRTVLQLTLAALVLLVSAGSRPFQPRTRVVFERRSPLEHVGALARAYEQISATRRASRLLVRGLRRRRDPTNFRSGTDEKFLRMCASRYPSALPSVELLLDAIKNERTAAGFLAVGEAVEHLERTLASEYD